MKMSKKQQYRSFSKRLTRRIMLALTLALLVVAACFNWLEADVFTHYYKVYCKILLDVKNETVRKALYGVEVATTYRAPHERHDDTRHQHDHLRHLLRWGARP